MKTLVLNRKGLNLIRFRRLKLKSFSNLKRNSNSSNNYNSSNI